MYVCMCVETCAQVGILAQGPHRVRDSGRETCMTSGSFTLRAWNKMQALVF